MNAQSPPEHVSLNRQTKSRAPEVSRQATLVPVPLRRATGGCPCGGRCPRCTEKSAGDVPLQKKLAIGASNDPLEQEAELVADRAIGASALAASPSAPPHIQRADGAGIVCAASAPSSVDHVLASPGSSMAGEVLADMSQRFAYDFSDVRVHTDTAAGDSAIDINALAYTVGNNIVFGRGQYAPDTTEGKHLLAHELTHVVQQSGGTDGNRNGAPRPLRPSLIRRYQPLSSAALELAAKQAPRMVLLLRQYGTLAESGVLAAEEAVAVSTAVAEVELAVGAAAEVAAVTATATAAGEGALAATAALVADDITVIGIMDDEAVPFTLLFGLAAFGVAAVQAYVYRHEISAALQAAIAAMQRLFALIERTIARHREPAELPVSRAKSRPLTSRERRPAPRPRPGPDLDIDFDQDRRRPCSYQSIAQKYGNYPCHGAFASLFSGVSREVRVITPEGEFEDMDAMDIGGTLYEVKTGYRWLVFSKNEALQQEKASYFEEQAFRQMIVAERCGHPLRWMFSDPYAASFFGARNAPYPKYRKVHLPVEVWYHRFDCPSDSV